MPDGVVDQNQWPCAMKRPSMSYSISSPNSTWLRTASTNTSRTTKPSSAMPATIASSRLGTSPAILASRTRHDARAGASGHVCTSSCPAVKPPSPKSAQCKRAARMLAPMRVLTVGNMYPPHHYGGYELVWHSAVEHLRSRGHEVEA